MDDEHTSDETHGTVVAPGSSYIAVVETFKSLAPIKDGILVDIEKSGEVCLSQRWQMSRNLRPFRIKLSFARGQETLEP